MRQPANKLLLAALAAWIAGPAWIGTASARTSEDGSLRAFRLTTSLAVV
jgi:hypothetical protein